MTRKTLLQCLIATILFFSYSLVQAEYFEIERYDIDVTIQKDGYFDVIETILVRFSEPRRGIIRAIPFREKIDGKTIKVDISNIKVDGRTSKIYREGSFQKIRIGDADIFVEDIQEYKIRYRVQNAWLKYDDFYEFHWNLIGTEWDVPIHKVNYTIDAPSRASILEYAAFSGSENDVRNVITIQKDGARLSGYSTESLKAGEGLSIAIKMPATALTIVEPQPAFNPLKDAFIAIPAAIIAMLIGAFRRFGRNRKYEVNAADIHQPPDGIAAAELGALIDDRVDDRDVLSLLPEWGRLGFVRMRSTGKSEGDIDEDMFIEKVRELHSDVPNYQHVLFNALFKERDVVLLSSLKETFYSDFASAKNALRKEVKYSDFYDPKSYKLFHSGWMLLFGSICVILGIMTLVLTPRIITGILLILMIVPALMIHFSRPKKSDHGVEFLTKLKSFKNFLSDPNESDMNRILKVEPDYFERMLPYAVAFGLDQEWMNTFDKFEQPVPQWYFYGSDPTHARHATMSQFRTGFSIDTVKSVFNSHPEPAFNPATGSTFSSGGSVGGGFGGGGGSSW